MTYTKSLRIHSAYKVGLFILSVIIHGCAAKQEPSRILVFSKTAGFRHIRAIEAGKQMLLKMGQRQGFRVDITEDASMFTDVTLQQYRAVVFLNVSGDVFNQQQQTAFQRYIEAGGGFLAIHGPTDAERNWPWYSKLIGAYFKSHPSHPSNVQQGTYVVVDSTNPATHSLPHRWTRTDEFYNFQQVNPDIHVLVKIDESTYHGGTMGKNHPMVWYHNFDGGRSFYTAMGHTSKTYSEPLFIKLIEGSLHYVMGGDHPAPLDYSRVKPEANRFSKRVLVRGLDEPMQMDFANDGRIFVAERRGNIITYNPAEDALQTIGRIPVKTRYEDGLLGLTLDPDFSRNRWLYVYYSAPDGNHFRVSRFTLDSKGKLDTNSEKNLLSIPKQVLDGSHTGGGLIFNKQTGNLYITVGDNSSPRATGYAPLDERPGRKVFNAARSAGNTNDLRGAILRVHPEDNGTYSIPEGNLFPPGTPKTRPELYTMGDRQPWRVTIDSKTGWIYWGEVGPDSRVDSVGRGPMAYDELNQAKKPGNYGWPFVVGPNRAYWHYNFATSQSGEKYDPQDPVNDSRYNDGLKRLPPAHPAFVWYPYAESDEFPLVGSGGRAVVGGPLFRRADFPTRLNGVFPPYYEGKWFVTDFIRDWINVISIDAEGNYEWMERFMKGEKFHSPLDMEFGPDGRLYVLAYGQGWFKANKEAGIVRIDYNSGNRAPETKISSDKHAGAVPLTVALSSKGSHDFDHDKLKYRWKISSGENGRVLSTYRDPNPTVTLDKPGVYTAMLTVSDDKGASNRKSIKLIAGNEPPAVKMEITQGNTTFFFRGNPIRYQVKVSDKEDGSLAEGTIADTSVVVSTSHHPEGYHPSTRESGEDETIENHKMTISVPLLINGKDCYSCHQLDAKSVGPSFKQIATRYTLNKKMVSKLSNKIIKGGSGNWGQVAMSAHPALSEQKANLIVKYILTRNEKNREKNRPNRQPVRGSYTPKKSSKAEENGTYVMRASYTDEGDNGLPPLSAQDELILRSPTVYPQNADHRNGLMSFHTPDSKRVHSLFYGNKAYIGYDNIDLTGISDVKVKALPTVGGYFEIHAGSPNGEILGTSKSEEPLERDNTSLFPIRLKPTAGKKDIYLVAKNDTAKYYNILFSVNSLEFKQAKK